MQYQPFKTRLKKYLFNSRYGHSDHTTECTDVQQVRKQTSRLNGFIHTIGVSVSVLKLVSASLIFADPAVKVNGTYYYCSVLRLQQLLPCIYWLSGRMRQQSTFLPVTLSDVDQFLPARR